LIPFYIVLAIVPAFFAEDIFIALGQNPEVSRIAHIQILYGLPSAFFNTQFDLYEKWLSAMQNTFILMVATIFGSVIHVPLCFIFVDHFEMDIRGLPVANAVRDFVILLFVMVYVNCSEKIKPALSLPNWEAFQGWGEYMKVSLPATIMVCA
jgi:MATE family multidrug resistance protein